MTISIWRPLINAVEDWPLAICDSRTVREEDLVETDHVRRHYTGSTLYLMHNPDQKWYYMSSQGKSDVLIFKNFDSDSHSGARGEPQPPRPLTNDSAIEKGKRMLIIEFIGTPHCSFQNPTRSDKSEPRQSVEVRALVFTYPPNLPRPMGPQAVGMPRREIYGD